MSKNIKLNDTSYNGVSTVQLPTTSGGKATFKDVDEITTPSGTKTITTNGTHDVKNYASANVNIPTPSGSKTITENGTHDVTNYAQAIVNVASSGGSGDSSNDTEFLKAVIGWHKLEFTEDVHFVVPNGVTIIKPYAFAQMASDKSNGDMYIELPDTIELICNNAFNYNACAVIGELPPNLKTIWGYAFAYAPKIFGNKTELEIPASVEEVASLAFYQYNGAVNTLTFKGTPTTIANNALQCNKFTTINVPWSEGEVANAPWGATSATINYNYTGA